MPTYRNNSDIAITYNTKGGQYSFPPHKDYEANVWVPYQKLGLELVDPDYPPVPESMLVSGTFKFEDGLERKFNIRNCDRYRLRLQVRSGKVKYYGGKARIGAEITEGYERIVQWDQVPYVRIVGMEDGSEITIDAEVVE